MLHPSSSDKDATPRAVSAAFVGASSSPQPPSYPEVRGAQSDQQMRQQQQQQQQPQQIVVAPAQAGTITLDVSQPSVACYGSPQQTNFVLATQPSGYTFSARNQQVVPVMAPAATMVNLGGHQFITPMSIEPPEAAVARPLSIISLFCFFQICFSIPAIVLACKRNKNKRVYKTSMALSVTSIVLGFVFALALIIAGMFLPVRGSYYYSDYYRPYNYYNDYIETYPSSSTDLPASSTPSSSSNAYSSWMASSAPMMMMMSSTGAPYYYPWSQLFTYYYNPTTYAPWNPSTTTTSYWSAYFR